MYNHNKAQQSKNRVHISWDILYTRAWYGGGFYLSFLDGHAGFWCPICGICNPFVTSITESRRVDDLLCCSYFHFGRSMGQWSFGFESHSAIKYLCGQNDNYEMPWCIRICGRCSFLPGWDADPVPQSNVFGTSNHHWLFRLYPCGYVDILDINGVFLMSIGWFANRCIAMHIIVSFVVKAVGL